MGHGNGLQDARQMEGRGQEQLRRKNINRRAEKEGAKAIGKIKRDINVLHHVVAVVGRV
jgi:hypothetical protein